LKILIVDDQPSNRLIAKYLVESEGHTCIEAEDGQDAIEKFMQQDPDLVLMDIMMPRMDGYESACYIKKNALDNHVPIIFLTAKHDENSLLKCLECGGDDYLIKPINGTLLKAKIRAHSRTLELTQQIHAKNSELSLVHASLTREHEMGCHVLSHSLERNLKNCPNIRQYMSSMSTFNGDISLIAENPNGGLYVFLGDFTGHGLSAAMGTIPLSQLFFSMCEKGCSISDITTQMNQTLKTFLPEYMFCAATLIHLFERGDSAHIWTGGLPDAYVVRPGVGVVQTIKSNNMPLGILSKDVFKSEPRFYSFENADKLVLMSDGILEATCPFSMEMFGETRLRQALESNHHDAFKGLIDAYHEYVGEQQEQGDDISLIELSAEAYEVKNTGGLSVLPEAFSSFIPWNISLMICPDDIRSLDVVKNIVSLLPSSIRIFYSVDVLRTILSELFSNALEHGLLKLSSNIKEGHDGFVNYYQLREDRLSSLEEGYIKINISTYRFDDEIKLKLSLEDSGNGFDVQQEVLHKSSAGQLWGRGIELVRSLSEELIYSNQGRKAEAIVGFKWPLL
tara:strand:+ start:68 stop:1762 length:1695 start_codon:yes stop_codon:yes gene_type:complete